ncbi:MAG TPA: type I-C CRISPR-associated protein Cas8c/Csd1, partial [Bacteroidales bacterium]|nr:type I-C CRISPR-associated protein Cas8c/Csd1 [Bacteroidales bacterium]
MIRELAEFGKRIRTGHDALKDEPISIDLIINEDGSFNSFSIIEKIVRPAEAITAKKGKARLLLDKAEEVLNYVSAREIINARGDLGKASKSVEHKHRLFIEKLQQYQYLELLKPVFLFYNEKKESGINVALKEFEILVGEKEREGNIAFRVKDTRLHEHAIVYNAIIEQYENLQAKQLKGQQKKCSVCGNPDFPVLHKPHGMIKRVPDGQKAGCALVSYNENAFESYGLKGNNNSSICTACAKNYVEGLNWLLSNGTPKLIEDRKGKIKTQFTYSNRKDFGKDTAMIYWTREKEIIDDINLLDGPDVGEIDQLIKSVNSENKKSRLGIKTNQFYSCTLSGAAARISVRDWIEVSLDEFRQNLVKWFQDIAIKAYGEIKYTPLFALAKSGHNTNSKNDPTNSRIAAHLWNAALRNSSPPLWILTAVLKRIKFIETTEDGKTRESITPERAALIRLILNRNNKNGGYMIKEQSDSNNRLPAIVCGKIFAVMESIQRAALGKDLNAGIRDRFFSFASTSP